MHSFSVPLALLILICIAATLFPCTGTIKDQCDEQLRSLTDTIDHLQRELSEAKAQLEACNAKNSPDLSTDDEPAPPIRTPIEQQIFRQLTTNVYGKVTPLLIPPHIYLRNRYRLHHNHLSTGDSFEKDTESVSNFWKKTSKTYNISTTVRSALIDLYISTNGDQWLKNDNWNSNEPYCKWYGVICTNGTILQLELHRNNLTGSIPSSIAALTSLEQLILNNNKVTSLPSSLCTLTGLTNLHLYGNRLRMIPSDVGNLTQLVYLYLSDNFLSQLPASMQYLTSLQELSLGRNDIFTLPNWFGKLSSLKVTWLNNVPLVSLPESFGNISTLEQLWLSNSELKALPSSFENLTSLLILELYGCKVRYSFIMCCSNLIFVLLVND